MKEATPKSDKLRKSLLAARPSGPAALEQRLAVASILAATGADRERARLGRLEIQTRLGAGAMGVVYRAYDPNLERLVAVKVVRSSTQRSERERIAREARALAKLSHPNVVAVYDIVDEGDELYFSMEYVAGMTLRGWLDSHPEADWREILGWFVQAGKGLAAAHEAGLVHRDFKPENVLVGDDSRARVADFGLAREEQPEDEAPQSRAGTPYYMAPETTLGQQATELSDQFSFCRALADALESKEVPRSVLAAAEKGLQGNPEKRHASMTALVELLRGALTTSPGQRPRTLLLERVERLWLRGVLERSLGAGGAVELDLVGAPDLVNPPWESWGVKTEDRPGQLQSSSRELAHLLSESNGSLLLVGPPGAGKTTLLLLLCKDLWHTASVSPEAPAPVVLSLSTFRPEAAKGRSLSDHFAQWVIEELVTKYGLARRSVQRWFDEAALVLLLDGLDEAEASVRPAIVNTLNEFKASHALSMVVTCRDSEYTAFKTQLTFGSAVQIQPLTDEAIASLVKERRATHLLDQLAREESLRDELRNPLLLTLYASGDGNEDVDGPGWARAYRRYVDFIFAEQSGTANPDRLLAQLRWLARAMRRKNTSDLWLERLDFDWLEQPWERRFAYISAALVVMMVGSALNFAQVPITGTPLESALTFGVGVSVCGLLFTRGRIKPTEKLRWSWRRALRLLPLTMVCATVIGLAEAIRVNFTSNMVGAAITGTILALVLALEPGERATQVTPNAGIRQSLSYALKVSFGFGVPVGLAFTLIFQPYVLHPLAEVAEYGGRIPSLLVGMMVGSFCFSVLFLIYGGVAVLMHYVLRLWLAWRTPLPLRLEAMLNQAVDVGVMRQVGGGYVFLHRTLLDYFADQSAARPSTPPVDTAPDTSRPS